jgi:hypothetical protein
MRSSWTGVKDTGRGASLSPLGYLAVTRPKSYHLRSLEPLDRPGSGPAGDDL